MHLSQLQDRIGQWHARTFDASFKPTESHKTLADHITDKILEECEELLERHDCGESIEEIGHEAADVAIALLSYCSKRGIDLEAEILKKHCVNLKRVFKFEGGKFKRDKP